jgi:hypothetical protein
MSQQAAGAYTLEMCMHHTSHMYAHAHIRHIAFASWGLIVSQLNRKGEPQAGYKPLGRVFALHAGQFAKSCKVSWKRGRALHANFSVCWKCNAYVLGKRKVQVHVMCSSQVVVAPSAPMKTS